MTCSTIAAWSRRAYRVDDQVVGVLGVIGPTRMNYQRVIPIVDVTARLLAAALRQWRREFSDAAKPWTPAVRCSGRAAGSDGARHDNREHGKPNQ